MRDYLDWYICFVCRETIDAKDAIFYGGETLCPGCAADVMED